MKSKFKHNKKGKFESRYTEAFKRMVIEEYLTTGTPKQRLLDKYGITYRGAFQAWMPALGYVDIRTLLLSAWGDTRRARCSATYGPVDVGKTYPTKTLALKIQESGSNYLERLAGWLRRAVSCTCSPRYRPWNRFTASVLFCTCSF